MNSTYPSTIWDKSSAIYACPQTQNSMSDIKLYNEYWREETNIKVRTSSWTYGEWGLGKNWYFIDILNFLPTRNTANILSTFYGGYKVNFWLTEAAQLYRVGGPFMIWVKTDSLILFPAGKRRNITQLIYISSIVPRVIL